MKKSFVRSAAGILAAVLLLSVRVNAAPEVSAKAAILTDGATGRMLYEKNADAKSLIASTTKIMTGYLASEYADLDAEFAIPPEAVGIEGSSLYLAAGEKLTCRDLLYGLMLQSGNDAAMALAIAVSGSAEAFVELMNRTAQELGLTQTHYANPHGLDSAENYSTARDLAHLTAHALQNEAFAASVRCKTKTVPGRTLTNHNKLLWRYDGAIGVKTGYTKAAGRILVSAAERGGRRLIAVTICDGNDWADHAALLDYGFFAFTERELLSEDDVFRVGPAEAAPAEAFSYPMAEGEKAVIRTFLPAAVRGPLRAGEFAGFALLTVESRAVGCVPLYWREDLNADTPKQNIFSRLFGGLFHGRTDSENHLRLRSGIPPRGRTAAGAGTHPGQRQYGAPR